MTDPLAATGSLAGTRAVVTGGASGMGAGIVAAFTAAGGTVVSFDLQSGPGTEIAEKATADGPGRARFVEGDVTDQDSVDAGFDRAVELLGGLDVLVHAAGIAPGAPAESITVAEWERVLSVNATGTFLTNQAAFRHLRERGGRILNFASAAGVIGLRNKAHYAASKGAVLAWTRTVAQEWGRSGVTVNAIAPAISTPMYATTRASMTAEQLAAHDAQMAAVMPIDGRLGDVDRDLVPLMIFLAGPGSRFITGQVFAVDGGMLMVR
jgi:NAD(P)-dependent dehydrogenase (short-subunit alcohol dehydrogenase family)